MRCDNCGEVITSFDADSEVTCDVCGVVQSITQTIVEEYSHAYSQTQRAGRLVGPTQEEPTDAQPAEEDFDLLVGVQMVMDYLCKALIKTFAFSNQVEIEAKELWTRYLHYIVDNNIPISTMFNHPLPKDHTYFVPPSYIQNTNQIPEDYVDTHSVHPRFRRIINDMGTTSFEYSSLMSALFGETYVSKPKKQLIMHTKSINVKSILTKRKTREKSTKHKYYDFSHVEEHITEKNKRIILERAKNSRMPRSRKCSPLGFSLRNIQGFLKRRGIPGKPKYLGFLEPTNPARLCYMMESLYRHDFLWKLLYDYPDLSPLRELEDYTTPRSSIEGEPLDVATLLSIAESLGIYTDSMRPINSRVKINLINVIFNRIIEANLGPVETKFSSTNSSLLLPMIDLQLVCTIIFLALLKCRYGIVANDVTRWIIQGRIPLKGCVQLLPAWILRASHRRGHFILSSDYARSKEEEATQNLFTQTNAPHSTQHLEMITARFITSGLLNGSEIELNVHGLCRRIVHYARLPIQVLTIVDLILDHSMEGHAHPENHIGTTVYGTCFLGYPAHVFGAAVVLAACRILWPIFHYQPPAFPNFSLGKNECSRGRMDGQDGDDADRGKNEESIDGGVNGSPYGEMGGDEKRGGIKLQERFAEPIEFDVHKMSWIVRMADVKTRDSILAKLENVHVGKNMQIEDGVFDIFNQLLEMRGMEPGTYARTGHVYNTKERIKRLKWLCSLMGGQKEVRIIRPDRVEIVDGFKCLYFSAIRHGFEAGGINAIMWLLYTNPVAAVTALTNYYIPNDLNRLRRFVVLEFRKRSSHRFIKAIMHRYLNGRSKKSFTMALARWIKRENFSVDYWMNFLGVWSGSVLKCLYSRYLDGMVVHQEDVQPDDGEVTTEIITLEDMRQKRADSLDTLIDTLKGAHPIIHRIKATLPSNREVFYKIKQLFNTYPFYSGWSLEKSLEYDDYRSLVKNQRMQVLRSMREILDTDLCQTQNDYWTDFTREFAKKLYLNGNGSTDGMGCLNGVRTNGSHYGMGVNNGCYDYPLLHGENSGQNVPSNATPEHVDMYEQILEEMENSFQEMETITTHGRTLPRNPWIFTGKRYGGTPIAYLITLKVVSNFIGSQHTLVHHCLCDLEDSLIEWATGT